MKSNLCIFITFALLAVVAPLLIPPGTSSDEFQSLLESASEGDTFVIQSNQDVNTTIHITTSITLVGSDYTTALVCNSTDFIPFLVTSGTFNITLLKFTTCNSLFTITNASSTLANVQTPINNNGALFTATNSDISFFNSTISPFKFLSLSSGSILQLNETSLGLVSTGGGIISNDSQIIANGGIWGTYAPGIVLLQLNGGRLELTHVEITIFHSLAPSGTTTMKISNAQVVWTSTSIYSSGTYPQGGVNISQSNVTFDGVTFSALQFIGSPNVGALVLQNSNASIVNSVFANNVDMQSTKNGGALYSLLSNVMLYNVKFQNNNPSLTGGGFFAENSTAQIYYSSFLASGGIFGGSGLYAISSHITVEYSTFASNTASGMILLGGNYLIANCTIQNNTASAGGGAQVLGANAIFYKSDISFNNASLPNSGGGGISYENIAGINSILILESKLVGNIANHSQAIDTTPSAATLIIRDSYIQENAPTVGAGNYCCNTTITPAPSGLLCNYPTCNCQEADGCNCPFDFEWDKDTNLIPSVTPASIACYLQPCDILFNSLHYSIPDNDFRATGSGNTNFVYDINVCSGVPCLDTDLPCAVCQNTGIDICIAFNNNTRSVSALPAKYSSNVGFQLTYFGQKCYSGPIRMTTVNVLCANPPDEPVMLVNEPATCEYEVTLYLHDCSINFCAYPELSNCSAQATCNNTGTGFNCSCYPGYSGDGFVCSDENECNITGICGDGLFCENTDGSFLCRNCTAEKCHEHGNCAANGSCLCNLGFAGPYCNSCDIDYGDYPNCANCTTTTCYEHGTCAVNGSCLCSQGFAVPFCNSCDIYYGGYPNCSNCTTAHCYEHGTCAANGSCICSQGFAGPFCNSCDTNYVGYPDCLLDLCLSNNGGCDFHVECTFSQGNLTCSDCPLGTAGSGYNTCVSLCGNQICEPYEDCVSCPRDCTLVVCDICGDGICSSDETCKSCILDCKENCSLPCECSEHGQCSPVGICVCAPGWSGPTCSSPTAQITVTPNATVPSVKLTTRNTNSPQEKQVSFGISVQSLSEFSKEGDSITFYDLASQKSNFSFAKDLNLVDSLDDRWDYSAVLENHASVNITFIKVNNPNGTFFDFYHNQSDLYFPKDSLKVNLTILNWPFKDKENNLQVQFDVDVLGKQEGDSLCTHSYSYFDILGWTAVTFQDTTLYAKFETEARIDNNTRNIKFNSATNYSVTAIIPHFWYSAELDPDYVILVNPLGCSDVATHSISLVLVISIVIPIIVVIIASGIIYYLWLKEAKTKKRRLVPVRSEETESETSIHQRTSIEMESSSSSEKTD